MDNSYQITVNNTQIYDRKASESTTLDAVEVSHSKFHILKNNQAYTAEIIEADFINKTYTVKVNGNLTVKGISKPTKVEGTVTVADGKIKIAANFKIKLEDYNITGQPVEAGKIDKEPKITVSAEF